MSPTPDVDMVDDTDIEMLEPPSDDELMYISSDDEAMDSTDVEMVDASSDDEPIEHKLASKERPTPIIESSNDCVAVTKYEKPESITGCGLMIIGRFLAQIGGVLFFPLGRPRRWIEFAFKDHTLPESRPYGYLEEWHMNQNARRFLIYGKSFTPRILFRGFHDGSGGGHIGLNGAHGVTPHGFLQGKALTNMWDIPDLHAMICHHLAYRSDIVSDFSSWTQKLGTALEFGSYLRHPEGTIAVLDTTSIKDRIWHTVDLKRAEMSTMEYYQEYLIYGPVNGPKYHCVSAFDLCETTKIRELMWGAQFQFGEDPGSCAIERGAVQSAMIVAAFLQPRDAPVENLAVLTARFVSYRAAWLSKHWHWREVMAYIDMDTYLRYARDHIQFFAMHTADGEVSLIDDTVFTGRRFLKFELHLLQAVENASRVMAHEVRVGMWEVCRIGNVDEDWPMDVIYRYRTGDCW